MSYALHWTLEAEITFNKNIEYLSAEWNDEVLDSFLDRVEETLNTITQNPLLYSLHRPSENIRKCVINERIILYFRVVDTPPLIY